MTYLSRRRMDLGVAVATALAAVTALVSACSAVLGIESDRHVTIDKADDSGAVVAADTGVDAGLPSNWSCIDQPPPTPSTTPVQLKLFLSDVSTASASNNFIGTPIAFGALRACGTLDVTCASPVGQATSDDAGIAVITVPPAFSGFYEMMASGYTPAVLSRTPQLLSEYAQQGVGNITLIALGGQLAGVTSDPNLGLAIVSVLDCAGVPAPDMVIDVGEQGPGEKLVYLLNGLPSASARATDTTGSAVVYNVQPGVVTVATRLGNGRMVRSIATLARSGWVTYVQIRLDQTHLRPLDAGP